MEEKKEKKESVFYVKTKSNTYKIVADYFRYEFDNDENICTFMKKFPGKKNPETGKNEWCVAMVKTNDIEIITLGSYASRESIKMTEKEKAEEFNKTITKLVVGLAVFALITYIKKS